MKRIKCISLSLLTAIMLCTGCGAPDQIVPQSADAKVTRSEAVRKKAFVNKQSSYLKDETTEVLLDSEGFQKSDIVKVVKHGDHWHVFTKDGKEHITYKDPAQMSDGEELDLVNVVSLADLQGKNVTSIKVHGNHWHVFTADGMEYLTYEDPSSMFSSIRVEQYTGSHGSAGKRVKKSRPGAITGAAGEQAEEVVIQILQHGDHYHIYTNKGNEYISYTDPRGRYPKAAFGIYHGSHGDRPAGSAGKITPGSAMKVGSAVTTGPASGRKQPSAGQVKKPARTSHSQREAIQNLPIIGILGGGQLDRYDVVKILQHGDHYHLYDSKGREGITRLDPRNLYPKASFGQYEGSHGGHSTSGGTGKPNPGTSKPNPGVSKPNPGTSKPNPGETEPQKPSESTKPSAAMEWPEGITQIVDHGDHWHLYRGDQEVGIVKEDPRPHYPTAEYIDERKPKHDDLDVPESELFSYDSVEPKLYEGLIPYLGDLKNMTDFGSLKDTNLPVYGADSREDIFYWLHGNHYHAMSLKQVIRNAKAGEYGPYTAAQVVATVKYKIVNGVELDEAVDSLYIDAVKGFLEKAYSAKNARIWTISNLIYVQESGTTHTFNALTDFTVQGEQVTPKVALPGL